MSYAERKLRMNALQNRERLFNLDTWIESFFEACELIDTNDVKKMQNLSINDIESWLSSTVKGYKLTIILDYDGTLVPLKPHPDLAILSDDVKGYLEQLISFPEIDICLLSGRSLGNLKTMVDIKNMNLAGSHGLEVHLANSNHEDVSEQALVYKTKLPDLVADLRENVCGYGGWVEQKVYHCTFHWRDTQINQRQAMITRAKEIIQKHGFQLQDGHCSVEARPPIGWDKGRGCFHILEKLHGFTWADNVRVIFIGDDETDEDAMRALSGLGMTFRVGKPNIKTNATHRLADTEAVKVFLQWALQYMNSRKMVPRNNQGMIKKNRIAK
jgi:trehalose 6-phosphate synthase/phosphatase